jgi:hypothetical protein
MFYDGTTERQNSVKKYIASGICVMHLHQAFASYICIKHLHQSFASGICISHLHQAFASGICNKKNAFLTN